MDWLEFLAAFGAFFLSHSLPLRTVIRQRLVALMGPRSFILAYSALSLAVLGWVIGAAGRAPYVPLWPWQPWQLAVPLGVMLLVCLVLALSLGRPNPFSFGGMANDRFDPVHPGLVRWTRHPLLLALGLWAGAHLVPNGDLAHVILFGTFAVFAFLGMGIVDRRRARMLGPEWQRLRAEVAMAPSGSWRIIPEDVFRTLAGTALYAGLIWLHPLLFGVSPLP